MFPILLLALYVLALGAALALLWDRFCDYVLWPDDDGDDDRNACA